MLIAVIPNRSSFGKDKMFDLSDPIVNRDHLSEPICEMRSLFESRGDELHTIDMYKKLEEVDYFLFFMLDWKWVDKIVKAGKGSRMVYCTAEPPSVDIHNTLPSYHRLSKIFPYIMTWNDEWVDNQHLFKRITPYYFVDDRANANVYDEKKLLTFISGNKNSDFQGELYSERRRAISYFENKCPGEFVFYGTGWDSAQHECYGGTVSNKSEVFHKYKFAICYENISLPGYITEKIFDCLAAGIVPIYAGAPNIYDYVPKECFISLEDFKGYDDLYEFLNGLSEEEYQSYLLAADCYIKSGALDKLSGGAYGECIYEAIKYEKDNYESSKVYRIYYRIWFALYKRIARFRRKIAKW